MYMFKLSYKAIQKFKEIYKSEFGTDLDDIEANRLGGELLEFFNIIYRSIPRTDDNKKHNSP